MILTGGRNNLLPSSFLLFIIIIQISSCSSNTSIRDRDPSNRPRPVAGQIILNLNGNNWTIQAEGDNRTYPANVPGGVYMALFRNKVIDNPYEGFNDVNYRWISKKNWIFNNNFTVTRDLLKRDHVVLAFDGLDTVSKVSLNGRLIGNTSNMFVRYEFDIKNYLKVGPNELKVAFTSPVKAALELSKTMPHEIPPKCPSPMQKGECHVNMLRKTQSSFSWDWGPAFPDMAIWKSVSLLAFNSTFIENALVNTVKGENGSWSLEMKVYFFSEAEKMIQGQLTVELLELDLQTTVELNLTNGSNSQNVTLIVPADKDLKLWWPAGYGNAKRYPLKLVFTSTNQQELSSKIIHVGFRTVELVQENVSSNPDDGHSFYFKINEIPIFFKGSNWIPQDSFPELITEERIRNLLQSAVDANQNAIRIWGGGFYPSDKFYNITDELGIMVWQDFMFAVALYPSTKEFLDSVKQEIKYQVCRLQYHPSIITWAGNNEIELAIRNNWFGTSLYFQRYKNDYVNLFVNTIMPIVKEEDPLRPYVTSSPSNGIKTEKEGWINQNPDDLRNGDIHHYDYVSNLWKDYNIPIARFISEYGLQSWPSFTSLERVANKSTLSYWGRFAIHRQHHLGGQVEMEAEILQNFQLLPLLKTKKIEDFKKMIYMTQINQAMGIRFESEKYRRHQSELTNGLGLTMGALYWQLNDIWQAPTWSSLEYDGTWKMLHYFSKKFFSPTLISPYINHEDKLQVAMVIDGINVTETRVGTDNTLTLVPTDRQNRSYIVTRLYKWSNNRPLRKWKQPFRLRKTSAVVFELDLKQELPKFDFSERSELFFHFTAKSGETSWLPLGRFKTGVGIQNAKIKVVKVIKENKNQTGFSIYLRSNVIAPFVWLEANGIRGHFSDNGFLLIPKRKLTAVQFFPRDPLTAKQLKSALTVKSLMDVYQ